MSSYREKREFELSEHIKKATNDVECAPKQKHVRWCIVYSWDHSTSAPFWNALKGQPVLSNEIQCFKALILIHKVLLDGPQLVLTDALREQNFLNECARQNQYSGHMGYHVLVRNYVQYLRAKLEFHRIHPQFNGKFDYKEYITQRGLSNLDDRYETISELLDLMDQLDMLAKNIIRQFRGGSDNECRQAALIPLVEESDGMYKFTVTMLTSMFGVLNSSDPLIPLKDRFNHIFNCLRSFYDECRRMRYLTSIIPVPELPHESPFPDRKTEALPPKKEPPKAASPPPPIVQEPIIDLSDGSLEPRPREQYMCSSMPMSVQQPMIDPIQGLRDELSYYRDMVERNKAVITQYQNQISIMETNVNMYNMTVHSKQSSNDSLIQSLQAEVAMWKSKYETMADMYQTLRRQHMELLRKHDELEDRLKAASADGDALARLQAQNKEQSALLTRLMGEKNGLAASLEKLKESHGDEVHRLRREAAELKSKIKDLAKSKGEGTQAVLDKFMREKHESDALYKAQIDQALQSLTNLHKSFTEKEAALQGQLGTQKQAYREQLQMLMDQVLGNCEQKIQKALDDYDNSSMSGNPHATPEITLSIIEKAQASAMDLKASMTQFVGSEEGRQQVLSIQNAHELTSALEQFLFNVKTVVAGLGDDAAELQPDALDANVKGLGTSSVTLFKDLQSSCLSLVLQSGQPGHIADRAGLVQARLTQLTAMVEPLLHRRRFQAGSDGACEELGDTVAREMSAAAKAIEAAAARLGALNAQKDSINRGTGQALVPMEKRPILDSSLAITDAIALLIKYATKSQQEIVAHGRGSGSPESFYKKNSRWTEGLISAAKAVAAAVGILGETADGVMQGTHKIEQLIVASRQVAAATAQLLAASRVKAVPHSRVQGLLEEAARAVASSTKALVEAAERSSEREEKAKEALELSRAPLVPESYQSFKIEEMNKQVAILSLEKSLENARKDLASFRKHSYRLQEGA